MVRATSTTAEPTLVGRDEEAAAVRAALARGGCVIAGPAGIGKSRLAAEAAAAHATQARGALHRAIGTSAASTIPFGAFAHLIPVEHGPARAIAGLVADLRDDGNRRGRPTLIVEDAHLLDDASATLVVSITASGAADVLLTVRSNEPTPGAVMSLWKDRGLTRVDLHPLARDEVRELVNDLVGATAHAAMQERIFELSQGNPLFVCELVRDAATAGALVEDRGRVTWTGDRLSLDRLQDLVAVRTDAVAGGPREVLEFVAVGGSIPLDVLTSLVGAASIEGAERAKVVQVGEGPEPTVRPSHPLLGEVVARSIPTSAARRLRTDLARAMSGPDSDEAARLLAAQLLLEAGEAASPLYGANAPTALRRGDPGLAERLTAAAGADPSVQRCRARALMELDRFDEVENVLASLEAHTSELSLEDATDYLRTRTLALHWGGAGSDAALDLLRRAAGWQHHPHWAATRASLRGRIHLDQGRPAAARRTVEALAGEPHLPPQIRLDLVSTLALALSRLGQIDACEALDATIQATADETQGGAWDTGWVRHLIDTVGRAEAARDLPGVATRLAGFATEAGDAGDVALRAAVLVVLGRLDLLRGQVTAAIDSLEEAIDWLALGDPRNARGLSLACLARARALAGDEEAAALALAEAEAAFGQRPNNLRLRLELARARAWLEAVRGNTSAGRRILLETAAGAEEDVAATCEALYDAVRLGADPRQCGRRLDTLLVDADNELLLTCADHVRAVAEGDPEAQLRAADRFAVLGLDLFAAEAAGGSVSGFRSRGRRGSATRASAFARSHFARCQVRGPTVAALDADPLIDHLTAREIETCRLAARGMTNQEIADELVLSIRSVETYVLRACRKLGVSRRHELAGLMGDIDQTNRRVPR